ncbi:lipoamide acyltransferase component of branched-chain alpha-keto acid dehydrogenase complex, putative [Plasmodium gallinaceum]|uniref:Dihydrolipoamide acetyltransferase component of pyruvate dehydrogenase complex n=1 Tax=Plasmodium gallinaceum TaxID=5849 RepID=A0A1J1GRY6_PLAGA|nr:lipoamide acyltransferase component of branched-chain alpha-keto acid dehydrogenase complex, putative [Plasmodium gallinaceum]CRG95265.1 lipoamide acyltransferase component of branched-chain alpha-keto acid dehydrogenase complex, putative [Plasmodium gallinaceum]
MITKNIKNIFSRINLITNKNKVCYINTSALNFKVVKCKLFDIGEGISEVEITQWNKNEGDQVNEMESLLTVQSDKASVDITSKYSGVLIKKYANEKDLIKVGSYFCEIDTEDGVVEEKENNEEKTKSEENEDEDEDENKIRLEEDLDDQSDELNLENPSNISNTNTFEREQEQKIFVKASPGVKKKAKEYNLDINTISKYFNKQTITMDDVENYYNSRNNVEKVDNNSVDILEEVPLKGIKLAMCKSMNDSLSIPLFHLNEMCMVENLLKIKNEFKKILHEKENINITITCIIIKLISIALNDFPILNSKFDSKKNSYTIYKNHNVCVAMDTPNGLLVPNIKNVEKKNIIDIQKDLTLLRDKAINMKLSKSDISDGTVTISNFGAISGSFATPIVFDNQACIIGVSKVQRQLFLKNEKNELNSLNDIMVSDTVNLTYGADHRFIDGATLAQFSKKLKGLIENPISIIPFLK